VTWVEAISVRRALSILAAAALALVIAPSAHAAEQETINFEYGIDHRTWYWDKQVNEEVTPPVPPGSPVEPSQRVTLPSPQRPDTLPVGVYQAEHERMSAIFFDLVARGVTLGSQITNLEVTIEESQDKNEWPSVHPNQAAILACPIGEFWPDSDGPEKWEERPEFTETNCVEGKRKAGGAEDKPATWTFDLTELAQPWGEDPFAFNNGVMLLGNLEEANDDTSWQINLKIPSRDDDGTEEDEYKKTDDRVIVDLAFVPGEPVVTGEGLDTYTSTGSGSFGSSTAFGPSGGSTFGGSATTDTGTEPVTDTGTPVASKPVASTPTPTPKLPPYVWALLPLGLIALAAVRSVVLEPVGGTRPDGVIAAIRRRNAERRGGPLRELSDPLSRSIRAARTGMEFVRRRFRGFSRGVSSVARKLRKR
jgi:hypothetical protein